MPSYRLCTSNYVEEKYTGKCGTNCSTGIINRSSTLHYKMGKLPSFTIKFTGDLTAHCTKKLNRNTTKQNSTLTLAHTNTVQTSSPPVSPVYVEVSIFMGSLNMCIICTQYVTQCWEQVTPKFLITLIEMEGLDLVEIFEFQLPDHCTFVRRTLYQPQKLHSQLVGLVTAVMYRVAGLTCTFVYGVGLQPAGVIHNNLDGYTHHLLFFHVWTATQSTITGVSLCHKKFDAHVSMTHVSFDHSH